MDRYALKKIIDAALAPYGVGCAAWVTDWSQLRIVKYDHPYSSDRSIIYQEFIQDESDWNLKRPLTKQSLAALQ